MLSRFHVAQPVRTYFQSNEGNICASCANGVFTSCLQKSLAEACDEPSVTHSYSRLARDLHASALAGCPWCTCIGNAVLSCSDLDSWMEAWNGSRSDAASLDENDRQQEAIDDTASDEGMTYEDEEASDEEDEDAESERPGFHTVNALNCAAELDITIKFLKWNSGPLFNLAEVRADVSSEDEKPLPNMIGEKAVMLKLEVIGPSTTDGPAAFNQQWRVLSAASCEEWVPHAETWLRACKAHASCTSSGASRPTRLIDVHDPRHPRLIITDDVYQQTELDYVALSYVWGPKQEYILTRARLADMRDALDLTRLPKTLSDSILAAHHLGFKYLWIDALCIIQDSPQDKALELPRMSNTYRESALTLVIASAAAATDGFLKTPAPPKFLLHPFKVPSGLTFGYRLPYKASADPISSRAWTLQERVLSRRLLIFSSTGVMWMCREDFSNPSAAPDAGPPYQTFLDPFLSAHRPALTSTTTTTGPVAPTVEEREAQVEIRETWATILADYTEMDLSYCTDKLPAISAVAAEIGEKTGWTYLAGMWKEDLFSELHWRCMKQRLSGERLTLKPKKVADAGYLAPSWSWSSVGSGAVVGSEDERDDREVFGFEILECRVEPVDRGFAYGPVKSGYLEVSGRTVELRWRYEDRPSWDGSDICLVEESGTPLAVGDGTLDPLDEPLDPAMKVVCLGMSRLRLGRQRIVPVEGLILVPKGNGASFRRIGFFRMTAPSVFDGAVTRVLRIE
ncbi:hypothetical protein OQA88_10907 [Cercophora sp. LCS_1]